MGWIFPQMHGCARRTDKEERKKEGKKGRKEGRKEGREIDR
jgi:hypothetical protein